jgi:hypothetical protein
MSCPGRMKSVGSTSVATVYAIAVIIVVVSKGRRSKYMVLGALSSNALPTLSLMRERAGPNKKSNNPFPCPSLIFLTHRE